MKRDLSKRLELIESELTPGSGPIPIGIQRKGTDLITGPDRIAVTEAEFFAAPGARKIIVRIVNEPGEKPHFNTLIFSRN